MNIFEDVKQAVDIKTAAVYYGLTVKNSLARCPFHNERTGSMKMYSDHFHCFGCDKHGDVITLTGQLLGLSPIDSARRLATDFNVIIHDDHSARHNTHHITGQAVPQVHTPSPQEIENKAYSLICCYINYLKHNLRKYAPNSPDEPPHPLFLEAINNIELFSYYKELFINDSFDDRIEFICENASILDSISHELESVMAA